MSKIIDSVKEVVEPIIIAQGMELIDIDFKKVYGDDTLTIYLDKDGGVNLDDCELIHNLIDEPLDSLDPTGDKPYNLNVSSAGLDRPLKTDRDYEKSIGKELEISLYSPIDNMKKFEGILLSFDQTSLTFEITNRLKVKGAKAKNCDLDNKNIKIDKKDIAVLKAVIKF